MWLPRHRSFPQYPFPMVALLFSPHSTEPGRHLRPRRRHRSLRDQRPRSLDQSSARSSGRRNAKPFRGGGWEELVSGFVAGNVNWNTKRLGAPPGDPDCRAPRDLLRSFGL
jgi:hypothetical protein